MKKHKTIKKVFAILMALSVVFSYSVVAMADPVAPASQQQIGNYFEADDNTGELSTSTSLVAGSTQQSYADGQVLVNKTIAGTDTENEFEITLDITTKNKIEEMDTSPDAAAVLVIDISGSMNNSLGKKQDKRIEAAQKAAQAFVDSFQSNTATRKVAVVTFSGNYQEKDKNDNYKPGTGINGATTILGWTDAKGLKIDGGSGSKINKLTANGGTNMEAGLKLAENLLNSSDVASIKNKNIILLTDGKPTFGISNSSNENLDSVVCSDGTNMIGTGGSTSHDIHTQFETRAKALSAAGIGTYAVYVGDEDVECKKEKCNLDEDAATWLSEYCGFVAKKSTDVDEITNIFKNISKLIEIRAKAWQLSDKMGDYISFESSLTEPGTPDGLSYDSDSKTLKWNLYATVPEDIKDGDGKVIGYEYTYTYKVKLNNLAEGFEANKEYPTNGVTSLSYFIEDSSSLVKPELSYAYFNVPSVKGFAGDLSFTKVNELGNPMTGVEFTLTAKDDSSFVIPAASSSEVKEGDTVITNAGTVSFSNIPSGHEYVLHEVKAPANYVAAADKDVTVSYGNVSAPISDGKIENVPDTTSVTVRKVWSDGDNQDNKRPASIQVQLYANSDKVGSSVELNAGNNWSYTFTSLPKAADGQELVYTVDEVNVPDGYTKRVDGFIITNSYSPETTTVSGHKTWVGDESEEIVEEEVPEGSNQDAAERTTPETRTVVNESRPNSITVNLLADGNKIDSETVTADDDWSWSFTNLPVYNNGKKIVYTVTEDTVTDYVTSINGYDITNTYSPNKTSVTVNKVWNDAGNQDGIRPNSVTVKLLENGEETGKTITLSADNNWQATFADLVARTVESDASTTIKYTVEEVSIKGYESSISPVSGGFTITNIHTPATTEVTVNKAWDDNGNEAGARPESVTVRLLADNVETGKTVTLSEENGWTATFTGLAKNANGKEISYTVAENAVTDYTLTDITPKDNMLVITNKYTPDTKSITVKKVWNDAENKDNIRPEDIKVTIKNGEETVATGIITEGDGWTYTFENLLKREAGKEITYTVEENPVEGYISSVSVDSDGAFIITNTHTPEEKPPVIPPFEPMGPIYKQVSVQKVWTLDDGGTATDSVKVQLYKNGVKYPNGEVTLSEANGWKYSWKVEVNATDIWTVEEVDVPEGFTSTVTKDGDNFVITNDDVKEEPINPDPSGDSDPVDDGDIDAEPNGDADADVEAKGVKTGDETMLALWGALGLIAALGLGGTLVIGRRREE